VNLNDTLYALTLHCSGVEREIQNWFLVGALTKRLD
jgi:hypothetical protein